MPFRALWFASNVMPVFGWFAGQRVALGTERWHRRVTLLIKRMWEMIVETWLRSGRSLLVVGTIALLGGCAAQGAAGGDPGARPMPAGYNCQSVRAELNKLDSRGVPAKVEAVSAGRRVSDRDQGDVTRYNQLLNYYLGGRCHV